MSEIREQELLHIQRAQEAQPAPEPQLPAVRQERKPRLPAQARPAHYPASIARAVIAITREMEAVTKEGRNEFQHYRYARWEDISEKLSPLLAEHGLMMMQSEINRTLLEQNDKGSVLAIIYNFTLVHESGEMAPPVEWTAIQRLRDQKGVTDDKAAAKCHTQAEKYFCVKQFKIRVAEETRGDQRPSLPKKDARETYHKLRIEIGEFTSDVNLEAWGKDPENMTRKRSLPPDWQDIVTTLYNEKLAELRGGPRVIWDDETGELIEDEESASIPVADPAPASKGPPEAPQVGADLPLTETLRLSALDATLEQAAKLGTVELQAAWHKIPPSDQKILEAAKNRRHKPTAVAADAMANT